MLPQPSVRCPGAIVPTQEHLAVLRAVCSWESVVASLLSMPL